ncbi:hypothetical protein CARUB_v10024511mg, partial [Capsella rubella]
NWLEYSVKKEKASCLCCYLFRDNAGKCVKSDAFITDGLCRWNSLKSFSEYVGGVDSFHNNAVMKREYLMKQGQSIEHALHKQDDITKNEYRIRMNASVDASRYLLQQGLAFRGHDESEKSASRENFVELIKYTANQNEVMSKVILDNAPGNNQMKSPKIQKDIVNCFAKEVVKYVIEEIDHDVFGLLVDESADISDKEQMAVVFRFVDKSGIVKEIFMTITHVSEISATALKFSIDDLFAKYGLSIRKVRGQGFYGASNMKGEFNGFRSLIQRESKSAYYVHCFAHQLQLVVVAVAKKHFNSYMKKIMEEIDNVEISTGTWLNQEISFQRPGNTRWNSHYRTLLRLIELFSSIIEMLEFIENDGVDDLKRRKAHGPLNYFHSFDFVFYLQMMIHLLGLTDNLSMALQRRDQDILNAMSLVKSTKRQLQLFRDDGWNSLMTKVSLFCEKHELEKLDMEADFVDSKWRRKKTGVSNMYHYKVNCLYSILDLQLQEFNDRFNEFDLSNLLKLASFYLDDFSSGEINSLEQELYHYIDNVRNDEKFSDLVNLGDLARKLVETRKHMSYPLVYRLLKLVLILPVATATVERYQFLNDCLVCFIEKDIFKTITNETVMTRFQDMKDRRMLL